MDDNNSLNAYIGTQSPRIVDSPIKSQPHRHTPSQDSCCSNDTLFNVEELNGGNENEKSFELKSSIADISKDRVTSESNMEFNSKTNLITKSHNCVDQMEENDIQILDINQGRLTSDLHIPDEYIGQNIPEIKRQSIPTIEFHDYITDFLNSERYCELNSNFEKVEIEENSTASDAYLSVSDNSFTGHNVAPLNSPDDKPWKLLQASFMDGSTSDEEYERASFLKHDSTELTTSEEKNGKQDNDVDCEDQTSFEIHFDSENIKENTTKEQKVELFIQNNAAPIDYDEETSEENETITDQDIDDVLNESSYDEEEPVFDSNNKNTFDVEKIKVEAKDCLNVPDLIHCGNVTIDGSLCKGEIENCENDEKFGNYEDLYGPLADIRFSGPGSTQLMTTSFSESNEVADDQEWESGSDSRSSSSGEFIWKVIKLKVIISLLSLIS